MNEVSNRVFGLVFDGLAARRIEPERLVEGTGISLEFLRDSGARTDWTDFTVLVERLEVLLGGKEALERIGYEQFWTESYAQMRRIAGLLALPQDLYWLGTVWFGRELFTVIEDEFEVLPDGRIRETLRIPRDQPGCPALFHVIRGSLRATPSMLDLPDATVDARVDSHEATFLITPPPTRRSLRMIFSSLRAALSQSARPLFEQLSAQQVELQRTNKRLSQTVAALRESEERQRVLAELGSDYGYGARVLADGRVEIDWLSGAFERLTGFTAEEILPDGWSRIVHPEDLERMRGELARTAEQGSRQVEYRIVTKSGETRWAHESMRAEGRDASGAFQLYGAIRDVTDRWLVQSDHDRLATAVRQAEEGIAVLDGHGRILYANPAFSRMMGRKPDSMKGMHIDETAFGTSDHELLGEIRRTLSEGRSYKGRYVTRAGGPSRVRDATVTPVRDSNGRIQSFVGVVHDVTREVRLEEALLRAQRMDALGRLAGGIAHDFNNLLTVISGYAEILTLRLASDAPSSNALEQILGAAERGTQLIRRLLAFSRAQRARPEPLDVNRMVEDVVSILRRVIGREISIETALATDLEDIRADPALVEHVLLNLALNARDAMPGGGTLRFTTRGVALSADEARADGLAPGPFVAIDVQDDGEGMDESTQARIFEPFFTTKEVGRGSGLGLSTAFGVVSQGGGAIRVSSHSGKGSTFSVLLPKEPPRQMATGERTDERGNEGGASQEAPMILLLESDPAVSRLAHSVLSERGYAVLEAPDPQAALEAAAQQDRKIDLLLSDLSTQNGHDLDLAARLSRIQPGLKVLYLSEYPELDEPASEGGEDPPGALPTPGSPGVLSKPFQAAELIERVRAVLGENPATGDSSPEHP
ncbi:MAG: hybrid sensor histidine kinase/response regulator [Myxococcota bacterium]